MKQMLRKAINFVREVRDEADTIEEKILFFIALMLLPLTAIIMVISTLFFLIVEFPKIMIPAIIIITVLWQIYKKL